MPYSFTNGNSFYDINTKAYSKNTEYIYLAVKDKNNNIYKSGRIDIKNIDKVPPTTPTEVGMVTTYNTISVKASGSTDDASGLKGYVYSVDEINWSNVISKNEYYVIDNLKHDTEKTIYARAVDNANNQSQNSKIVTASTISEVGTVTITLSNYNWTKDPISASISYSGTIPTGYCIQYKLTGYSDFVDGDYIPQITDNTTIIARVYNKSVNDEIAANTENVTKFDKIAPTLTSLEVVSPATGTYYNDENVVIEAEFSENVYDSTKGTLNGTTSPELKIKFGTGEVRTAVVDSSINNKITYKYTLTSSDVGVITLVSYIGNVYDHVGNQGIINKTDSIGGNVITRRQRENASISFADATVTKTYGAAQFTNILTNTGDSTVTYASSNTAVATINSSNIVTVVGEGETTITATVVDTENYVYQTKVASYVLTVNVTPVEITNITITKSDATLTITPTYSGGTDNLKFTYYLDGVAVATDVSDNTYTFTPTGKQYTFNEYYTSKTTTNNVSATSAKLSSPGYGYKVKVVIVDGTRSVQYEKVIKSVSSNNIIMTRTSDDTGKLKIATSNLPYGSGWVLEYSTDNTNFTTISNPTSITLPTNATGITYYYARYKNTNTNSVSTSQKYTCTKFNPGTITFTNGKKVSCENTTSCVETTASYIPAGCTIYGNYYIKGERDDEVSLSVGSCGYFSYSVFNVQMHGGTPVSNYTGTFEQYIEYNNDNTGNNLDGVLRLDACGAYNETYIEITKIVDRYGNEFTLVY